MSIIEVVEGGRIVGGSLQLVTCELTVEKKNFAPAHVPDLMNLLAESCADGARKHGLRRWEMLDPQAHRWCYERSAALRGCEFQQHGAFPFVLAASEDPEALRVVAIISAAGAARRFDN